MSRGDERARSGDVLGQGIERLVIVRKDVGCKGEGRATKCQEMEARHPNTGALTDLTAVLLERLSNGLQGPFLRDSIVRVPKFAASSLFDRLCELVMRFVAVVDQFVTAVRFGKGRCGTCDSNYMKASFLTGGLNSGQARISGVWNHTPWTHLCELDRKDSDR